MKALEILEELAIGRGLVDVLPFAFACPSKEL